MKYIFDKVLREANLDRINKFSQYTDDQKQELKDFLKANPNGYDKYFDWMHPEKVTYDDFLKAKDAKENSKSQLKKKRGQLIRGAYNDARKLFEREDFLYQGENDEWIFVSPLSHEACVYADSVDCGGGKAGWCIGTTNDSHYWDDFIQTGSAFVMAFNKNFKDVEDKDHSIKYMIRLNIIAYNSELVSPFCSAGDVWNQEDDNIQSIYSSGSNDYNIIDSVDLTYDELVKYVDNFWNKMEEREPDLMANVQSSVYCPIEFTVENEFEEEDAAPYLERLKKDVKERLLNSYSEKQVEFWESDLDNGVRNVSVQDFLLNGWDALCEDLNTVYDVIRNYRDYYSIDETSYDNIIDKIVYDFKYKGLMYNNSSILPQPKATIKYSQYKYEIKPNTEDFTYIHDTKSSIKCNTDDVVVYTYEDFIKLHKIYLQKGIMNTQEFYLTDIPEGKLDIPNIYAPYFYGLYNVISNNVYIDLLLIRPINLVDCAIVNLSIPQGHQTTCNLGGHTIVYKLTDTQLKYIQVFEVSHIENISGVSLQGYGGTTAYLKPPVYDIMPQQIIFSGKTGKELLSNFIDTVKEKCNISLIYDSIRYNILYEDGVYKIINTRTVQPETVNTKDELLNMIED